MLSTFFKRLPTIRPQHAFCTANVKIREDWQYVRDISQYIKNNEINEAFNTLVRSYLNNKILDIQTYHALYSKMNEAQIQSSYKQLLYKLYRQHFQPHHLMKSWMDQIVNTSDNKLKKLLQSDYQKLNISVSIPQQKSNEKKISKQQQISINNKNTASFGFLDSSKKYSSEQPLKPQGIIQTQDFHSILETLTSTSRIILHDIQISFDNEDLSNLENTQQNFYPQQNEHEDQNAQEQLQTEDDGLSLADYLIISKIKIGKIQLIKNNDKKSPDSPEMI